MAGHAASLASAPPPPASRGHTHTGCSATGCGGAGQRRQMLTCCCREARARWLQMRHSSRLYALLPGSTPSLRPCHAPPKLRGLRGPGGCGRAGSPQLLREGRGRLQARLTDREALVDRHARSFRRVLLRAVRVLVSASAGGRRWPWGAGREALRDERGLTILGHRKIGRCCCRFTGC